MTRSISINTVQERHLKSLQGSLRKISGFYLRSTRLPIFYMIEAERFGVPRSALAGVESPCQLYDTIDRTINGIIIEGE